MWIDEHVETQLKQRAHSGLIRSRLPIQCRKKNALVVNNKPCVNFCSNDYLGLSHSKRIKKSFINGIKKYGFGSGSSALISGYFKIQEELEHQFSEFLNRDQSIIFN